MGRGGIVTRYKYKFWLDDQREGDHEIAAIIDTFKARRAYSKAIRDGLRLIADLEKGGIAVLLELYPHVTERLQQSIGESGGGDDDKLKIILEAIQQGGYIPAPPPNYPLMKESASKAAPVVTERKLSKAELKAMNASAVDDLFSDFM